jgi:AraC family transcriptional activator of pobA
VFWCSRDGGAIGRRVRAGAWHHWGEGLNISNMPPKAAGAPPPPARLPAYALYGEAGAVALPDRLHAESIAERSRHHDWEIRPHRHEALCQLLVLVRGQALARLDGQALALQGPAVVTVPALAAHGFGFSSDVEGSVFTLPEAHLKGLLAGHPGLAEGLLQLRGWPLEAAAAAAVTPAAAALLAEAEARGAWRAAALDAALLRLAVAVARALPPAPPGPAAAAPPQRALAHVQRLQTLVDAQFRRQPTQAALAAQLGLTPTQLNRACRQVLGHPALGVLHARLLLQARRELAYTALSVKQIALELGFADAGYFSRFFRRGTGSTPSDWRAAAHAAAGAPRPLADTSAH